MLKLFKANETNFDHNETILKDVVSAEVLEESNGEFSLTIEYPAKLNLEAGQIIEAPTPRGPQLFRIVKPTRVIGQRDYFRAYCRHIFYDLLDNFIEDTRPTNKTAGGALEDILNGSQYVHRFTGTSDIATTNTAYYIRRNPVQAIMGSGNSVLGLWGGHIVRDNFEITIKEQSLDRGYEVRFGKNLIGLDEEIDVTEVVTRIYPTAVINDPVVTALPEKYIDSPLIGTYPEPVIRELRVELTDTEKELPVSEIYDIMRQKAQEQFTLGGDKPLVNYKVDFLHYTNDNAEILKQLDLNDTVRVVIDKYGINLSAKVIKYTYDSIKEKYLSMELGNFKDSLANQRVEIGQIIDEINKTISNNNASIADKMKAIGDMISGNNGGYKIERFNDLGQPYETLYMDSPNLNTAVNVIRLNKSGIGFSTSGYNGPFNTAITIDGKIMGQYIVVNSLEAISANLGTITAGRIQDADNESYWDLNSKEIKLNVNELRIQSKSVATMEDLGALELQAGDPSYVHIRYSANSDGSNFTETPQADSKYVGFVSTKQPIGPTGAGSYDWMLIKGEDGIGQASYIHVKYSPFSDGLNMTDTPEADTRYIGVTTSTNPTPPTARGAYDWTRIRGEDGRSISSIDVEYYRSDSATSLTGGSWSTTAPAWVDGKYMWSRTKTIFVGETTPVYSKEVMITGGAGKSGRGIDSIKEQYYLSTSSASQVNGEWLYVMPPFDKDKSIWTRSEITWNNPIEVTHTPALLGSEWNQLASLAYTVSEVDQRTTSEAIVDTISEATYVNGEKMFTKTAEFKETVDTWTATFSEIGGTNVLLNSRQNLTNTTYRHSDYYFGTEIPKEGDTYTVTVKFSLGADRTSLGLYSSDGYNEQVGFTNADRNSNGIASKTFTMSYAAGRTPADGYDYLTFYQVPNTGTSNTTIEWVKLEKGKVSTDWSPHPDELYTGITEIDKDGLRVSRTGTEVSAGLAYDGLRLMRSDTGTPISSFTTDGVDADTITAKDIRSATVARVLSEDVTVYVGASETGDGSGRNSSNKASSVARALNTALDGAVYLMRYPTVTVNVSGSINEMVRIRGLSGHGRILLTGDSTARIVGTIEGMNSSCLIEIDGIKVVNGEQSANQLIIGNNATRMIVRNCSLDGYGKGYGIGANASNIHVIDCDFFRLDRALTASVNGNIHCHNSGGSLCEHVASAVYGGRVSLSGTRVAFNTALSLTGDGGTFIDDSTGINTKPYPGYIAPTWATKTVTFDADEIYTANVSNGYVWNRTEWKQGTWEGNGNAVRGYANFGSKVRDWLNSSGGYQGTPTITISAKRNASSGNKGNGAVSMMIGNPATLTLPAVPYGGGSSSATTGTALRNAIMTSSKLVLSSSTTSLANYGAFYDIKIKVTAQKKV